MPDKKRAAMSAAGNLAIVVVVSAGLLAISIGAIYQGAWWMVLLIAGLITWGVLRPRRRR